jgi:mycoredoxin
MSATEHVTVYTTTVCGPCVRLKRMLDDEQISYTEVNVEHDESAADWVMSINSGNQTVPTVKFADGSTLTDPTLREVKERLGLTG